MTNFEKWDAKFRSQNLSAFNNNKNGILWLKVRAICRGKQISQFLKLNHITLNSTNVSDKNKELFELLAMRQDAMSILDNYLKDMNHEWYELFGIDYDKLKEDLYQVQSYSWGGDYNNSLDKHLVRNYVKKIADYSELERKKGEIANNAWNYVQNSWYNNWTSFLIESLFKRNSRVISAVGEIKSVDFFIDNFPIDLKVTFFPNQYMEEKLSQLLGKSKYSWLKQKAKEANITVDSALSQSLQLYTITEKLYEKGKTDILDELKSKQRQIIFDARNNPSELMKWLYENQGEMRFGAENRLYLILVDTENIDQSWKLKRAFSIIEPTVDQYISSFTTNSLKHIDFTFNKKSYSSFADTIFIIR